MYESEFEERHLISAVDGAPQRYFVRHGKAGAPCMVVLHGHGSLGDQPMTRRDIAEGWTKFLVEGDYSVITPDLRGNAWMSEAAVADLRAIIATEKPLLSWNKLFITAGSMGGTGALMFAMRHPEVVDGVAAFGAATDFDTYLAWLHAETTPISHAIAAAIEEHHRSAEDRASFSVCAHADRLTMPIWYLHGGADEIIDVEQARALARAMQGRPNFHYIELPGGNHDSPLPHYVETVKELLK